ncbi:unnamed protein product [Cylindrotheca closterium]|uniref:Uncharacterized protein n=1 Tax=Cylindrotheca closterium TaxID=2856 RepID=A0AAD2JIW7_9STRA|nr:unnamed protein product [Cylindrotheca closterium]
MNGTPLEKNSTSVETVDTVEYNGSFSEETDDWSVVSAITFFDDEEEDDGEEEIVLYTSDRRQYKERVWSSPDPTLASPDSPRRFDRFSSHSDHGDEVPCRMPRRRLSTGFSSPAPKCSSGSSSSSSSNSCDSFDSFAACSEAASSLDLADIIEDRFADRYNVSRLLLVGR